MSEDTRSNSDMSSNTVNTAQLLVKGLEAAGVRFVFGYPGDENLPFLEAVRESAGMQFVLTRHEAGAGFMAAAYGYQTGELAVAMSTLGAGATNMVTATAHAWLAEVPMLVVTGQKPILDNKQGRYQLIDVVEVLRPVTKRSSSISSPQALPGLLAEATQTALEYPQGPVHLELPLDISTQDATGLSLLAIDRPLTPYATPQSITRAAEMLTQAKRPLVLIGGGANTRAEASPAVRKLLANTGLPFIVTMMGKGVGDEASDDYLGTAGMPGMGFPHCALQHADLVLSIGHNVMEKAPFLMTETGPQVIHVHDFPATPDAIWFPQHQVVGNTAASIAALADELKDQNPWDLEGFKLIGAAMRKALMESADDETSFPIKPQFVAATVRAALGGDGILSLDNGIHKLWLTRNYPAFLPRTVMVDSALGSMGPGLPAAIAAKLANPQRRVAAVVGDGGLLQTVQELETAVRLGIDLTVLVFNDGGLGMIRLKQTMEGFGNYGVDFGNPDIAALATAFGASGHHLASGSELPALIDRTFAEGGVHVIDVPVDYGENPKMLMAMNMLDCEQILAG